MKKPEEKKETPQFLIDESIRLKSTITAYQNYLDEINGKIVAIAEFNGKKTGHLKTETHDAIVTLRENIKWDQKKLNDLKKSFPKEFNLAFKVEYKPISAKGLEIFENSPFGIALIDTYEAAPGKPSVKIEKI